MTRIHFEGILAPWLGAVLAIVAAAWIWWWYRRETRGLPRPWPIVLPTLRAIAVALMFAMLTGPILSRQWLTGSLADIVVLIDESASMLLEDHNKAMHRSARVADWLQGDGERSGWLTGIRKDFHVEVFGFGSSEAESSGPRTVWDSNNQSPSDPIRVELKTDGRATAIGEAMDAIARGGNTPAAVVLVSDGQSNSGTAIADVADRLRDRKVPIFALGLGRTDEPNDLAMLGVDHPKSILATDVFQGTATIKHQLPDQTPYRFTISRNGKVLWSQTLTADGSPTRTLDYRVDGKLLFESGSDDISSAKGSVPLDLDFELDMEQDDAVAMNNVWASSLWGVTRRNRVLVMDRRGRWESRYIKNAFERDSAWEVDAIMGPDDFEERKFPASREELLPFDVLIVSMDSVQAWNDAQERWVADHIAESGAGFIGIDSGRDKTNEESRVELEWLPVSLGATDPSASIRRLELAQVAWSERAFAFEADEESNLKLWSTFPAPRVARKVTEKPGAEVFVVGRTNSDEPIPMIVMRTFGQGKVVYVANDESWRWRYNVADLYHQRFWSQITQWSMQSPFAMENEFAALDTGDRTCEVGAMIPIRALLKDTDRSPLSGARVYAVIQQDGKRVDSIPLAEFPAGSGMYAGATPPMPEGKFSISLEVPGIPVENIPWQSDLLVQAPATAEMQSLAQNVSLLEQIAQQTGGAYLDEANREKLSDLLRPKQSGKIEESRWPLWQSFPWFIAVVALLSLEWFLRKRAGLI